MAGYLTAANVAERWQCTPEHVQRQARSGRLAGMRLGRDWRFSLQAVEAYEATNTSQPIAAASAAPVPMAQTKPAAAALPAVEIGGEYDAVVSGPVPWRASVVEAASPAARRGVSATTRKRA